MVPMVFEPLKFDCKMKTGEAHLFFFCAFLQLIADAVTTGLPYIGKKIKEAFLLVVDGFKAIIDSPVQSMTGMTRGVSQ